MEIIRKDEGVKGENSKNCKTIEYSFKNKEILRILLTLW